MQALQNVFVFLIQDDNGWYLYLLCEEEDLGSGLNLGCFLRLFPD